MTATGFYQKKSVRPGGLAIVITLHAAVLASLVLVKVSYDPQEPERTRLIDIFTPPPPDENPPPPQQQPRQQPSQIDTVDPIVSTQTQGPVIQERDLPPVPFDPNAGRETVIADASPDLPRIPVRVEAQFDPRSQLQPPYPASEEARQRDGQVRVRLTIGADGRVKAIERLSATSDAFWQSTQRHALARWRFRPATEDGRAVESTKIITLTFRIDA